MGPKRMQPDPEDELADGPATSGPTELFTTEAEGLRARCLLADCVPGAEQLETETAMQLHLDTAKI